MKHLIGILFAFAAMSSAQAQTVVSGSVAGKTGGFLAAEAAWRKESRKSFVNFASERAGRRKRFGSPSLWRG